MGLFLPTQRLTQATRSFYSECMSSATRTAFLALFLAGILLPSAPARACSIPVFRYALERWQPASYEMFIFHRGPLSPAHRNVVARFERPARPVNLRVQVVDLTNKVAPEVLSLWQKQPPRTTLPHVLVRCAEDEDTAVPHYNGALDEKRIHHLLDSPMRRQIVKLLAQGESAVWVLLESGDRDADDEAARRLRRELARLQKEIKLPEQTQEGPALLTDLPLAVSFPVVRLGRRQAGEESLVQMLLASEEGIDKVKGPLVFPIFGRGRVLCGLEVQSKEIEEAARFLCGACSCRVKELNPGVDLLLSADWDELLQGDTEETPAPASGKAPAIPPGEKATDVPAKKVKAPCLGCRLPLWGGGSALAVLAAFFAVRTLRRLRG
jgi:hypothetical protein